MNEMSAAIERLRFAVRTLPGVLAGFSESESEQRPSPERWTKKEVVGHLIDSASNNHQRFVRGQIASGQHFPGYEQEQWVRIQGYQSARWSDLIDLWRAYNTHLLHVAECMTEEGRRATCQVGGGAEVTLAGLFVDYVDHLEHHPRKMLGQWRAVRHEMGVTPGGRPDGGRAGRPTHAGADRLPARSRCGLAGQGHRVGTAPVARRRLGRRRRCPLLR